MYKTKGVEPNLKFEMNKRYKLDALKVLTQYNLPNNNGGWINNWHTCHKHGTTVCNDSITGHNATGATTQ